MTKPIMLITAVPFQGFYELNYSYAIDNHEEQMIDYETGEHQEQEGIPKELRLDPNEYADIVMASVSYRKVHLAMAKCHVDAFSHQVSDYAGIKLDLKFESMVSPREYNFETDRVFAHIRLSTVKALFCMSKTNDHAALSEIIKERFSDRSGFISSYDNELAEWLTKPLKEWDHNEIETLILAVIEISENDRWEDDVYSAVVESGIDQEYDAGMDWPKFEAMVEKVRDEKEHEYKAFIDPNYIPPARRCDFTPDMFGG